MKVDLLALHIILGSAKAVCFGGVRFDYHKDVERYVIDGTNVTFTYKELLAIYDDFDEALDAEYFEKYRFYIRQATAEEILKLDEHAEQQGFNTHWEFLEYLADPDKPFDANERMACYDQLIFVN